MKKTLILILILLSSSSIRTQVIEEWVRRYDNSVYTGSLNERALPVMDLDAAGNVYIGGSIDTDPGQGQNLDFVVIKYNPQGVQQWVKTYDGTGHGDDYFSDLKVDAAGNVFVTGASFIDNDTSFNFCTIKYNTQGTMQWINSYDSPYHLGDIPSVLDVDNSGNVCVAGWLGGGTVEYAPIIKINQNGTLAWSKIINFSPGGTRDVDIKFDNSGNIIAVLDYLPFEITYWCLYKFNQNGDSLWCKDVDSQFHGGGVLGVKPDSSGNLYIAGNGTPYFGFIYVGYIKKLSPTGNLLWSCSYTDIGYSQKINDFCIDNAGSVYTTGTFDQSGTKYLTSKFSSGSLVWSRNYIYNNSTGNQGKSIAQDDYRNLYVTGSSYTANTHSDYCTIKYSQQGDSIWAIRYNHIANNDDAPSTVKIDSAGNVYVTGVSLNSDGKYGFATVKYNQINGVKNISSEVPQSYYLSQNYPNPFNPVTKIKFSLPRSTSGQPSKGGVVVVKLVIFDVLGREIANLIPPLRGGQEGLQPGTYEAEWDGTNYPSGVYFYKLITADYTESRKMVLIK